MAKKATYGNESIKSLRGADRVRKRPAVIFGSDGLEGCEHSIFEIMSNSIDEAREGRGNRIVVTRYLDGSYEVQDFGSGIPVDYMLLAWLFSTISVSLPGLSSTGQGRSMFSFQGWLS